MKSNRDRCLQLRMAGASYAAIAGQLGIPLEEVERYVAEGVEALNSESSEVRARLELSRLDTLLMGIWSQAQRGDTAAVGQALKIIGQRTALLARLDGPASEVRINAAPQPVSEQVAWLKSLVDDAEVDSG